MNVRPTRCWIAFSSICISWRSLRSSAPSGSSSSRTAGWLTSARASATRWRCPPESCDGLPASNPSSRTIRSASATRSRRSSLATRLTLQAVLDVLGHRHVREQRVVLEHRVHVALVRREAGHVRAVQQDRARGRALEAGDHPQAGRLARTPTARASRRTRPARMSRSTPSTATTSPNRLRTPSRLTAGTGAPSPAGDDDGTAPGPASDAAGRACSTPPLPLIRSGPFARTYRRSSGRARIETTNRRTGPGRNGGRTNFDARSAGTGAATTTACRRRGSTPPI